MAGIVSYGAYLPHWRLPPFSWGESGSHSFPLAFGGRRRMMHLPGRLLSPRLAPIPFLRDAQCAPSC